MNRGVAATQATPQKLRLHIPACDGSNIHQANHGYIIWAAVCYPIPYPQNQHRIVISTKKNTISCVFQKKAVTLWADLLKTLRY